MALSISRVNESFATAPLSASGPLPNDIRPGQSVRAVSSFEAAPGVQVWYIPHDNALGYEAACTTLTEADRHEFASIRHLPVRRRSLKTRAVLRRALSEAVGGQIAPHEWCFYRTGNGKPLVLPSLDNLTFSCSHTPWVSIIAVSTVGEVGIDIEEAVLPAGATWLSDVLSVEERSALAEVPDSDRGGVLTRLWTLKEAYLKLLGIGIDEPSAVAFDSRNDRLISGHCPRAGARPEFRTWTVDSHGRRLSVALAMSSFEADGVPSRRRLRGRTCVFSGSEFAAAG